LEGVILLGKFFNGRMVSFHLATKSRHQIRYLFEMKWAGMRSRAAKLFGLIAVISRGFSLQVIERKEDLKERTERRMEIIYA
jgi:hypothetical protein